MPWNRDKPWTAPAQSLVLYRADAKWRFAIYNDAGVVDGFLRDYPADLPSEHAQAHLLQLVETDTGLSYVAEWSSDKPDWWSATLTKVER